MRAWLITWEGTSPRIGDKNRIVAILSANRSHAFVEDLVDLLYLRATESAYGMAHYANRKRKRRDRNRANFSNGGRIFYGSNPFLYGRQVSDLSVVRDEEEGIETVRWKEPPCYRQNPEANYAIELVEAKRPKVFSRPLEESIGKGPSARVED